MTEIDLNWISAISTACAMVASVAASITAILTYKFHRSLEKKKLSLLKEEVLLKNIQSLIVIFANIRAKAKEDYSVERREELKSLSQEINYTVIIIASLSSDIGTQIELWRVSKDSNGNNIPYVVNYIFGNLGTIGNNYDDFLCKKSIELREIQNYLFKKINA
ncbi:MAG: hypothetical protein GY710_15295 [Desulfobacteraceae bacterium]|nr:hypothetical protein [Desulfobacteraceae bacterium]